jgi:hypothetical protein
MAIYAMGGVGGVGTTGVASTEIIAASTDKPKIMEICISQVAATASLFGLGRPAAIGVTPTTPVTLVDEQDGGGPVGVTRTAVAWATPPTVPTVFLRRLCTPATIGAGIIWTFPRGLGLPTSGSVVVWNAGTNSIVHFHVVADE